MLLLPCRLRGYMHYRAATHNLNHCFPDMDSDRLAQHNDDCAICREPMQVRSNARCIATI